MFSDRFASNTREHWLTRLEEQDLLSAPVRDMREALVDPQTLHNRMILEGEPTGRPADALHRQPDPDVRRASATAPRAADAGPAHG